MRGLVRTLAATPPALYRANEKMFGFLVRKKNENHPLSWEERNLFVPSVRKEDFSWHCYSVCPRSLFWSGRRDFHHGQKHSIGKHCERRNRAGRRRKKKRTTGTERCGAMGGGLGAWRGAFLPAAAAGAFQSWKVRSARYRTIRTFQIGVRSEFFQNSGIFLRNFNRKLKSSENLISTFSKISAKFRQNFIKIWAKIN